MYHIDGLVQDFSISSALAMEILQTYTKPSIWTGKIKSRIVSQEFRDWIFWVPWVGLAYQGIYGKDE